MPYASPWRDLCGGVIVFGFGVWLVYTFVRF